jgi:hypothetical protein
MEHIRSWRRKMTRLISVGFFNELSYGKGSGESLNECRSKFSEENIEEVLLYLKAGIPFAVAPGLSRDYLSSSHEIIGSLSLLTDGIFLWPSDLAYYVEKYQVSIPPSFYLHMKNNGWKVKFVDVSKLNA